MNKYIRRIALVADFHLASKVALFPPQWEDEQGIVYIPTEGQLQLYKYYLNFCGVCDELEVDTVIIPGDVIHGLNKKEYGYGLMFSDHEEQKKLAVSVLEKLTKNRRTFFLSGSPYHESLDTKVHNDIAKRLNGTFLGLLANVKLEPTKRVMNVAHGVGGAAIYATQILNREADFMLMASALEQLPHFDIVVRAHLHRFFHVHFEKQHLIQLPCWMAWEPNKIYVKYYGKKQPSIGGVVLLIDDKERITVWHYTYPCPHIADMVKKI